MFFFLGSNDLCQERIGQREAIANDKHDIHEATVSGCEFHQNDVCRLFNDEACMCRRLHHAQAIEAMLLNDWNRPCEFDPKPVGIRESDMLSNRVVCGSVTLETEDFDETVFEKPAIHECWPVVMLIQDLVCSDKILNEKIECNDV
jgi:hypothetical protein